VNQLNKDVSDIGAACLLRDNSGSDKNHQNAVGIPEQSDVSLDPSHRVLIPTILCGGAGSRLWPVSREQHPKPFIRLADGQSPLQKAFLRGALLRGVVEVLTVTNRDIFFKTEDEFREVNEAGVTTPLFLNRLGEYSSSHCGRYSASC
jgi:mannose-1-phosphate guanylyltransferase/mannose-6-phosphate isomerase